MLLSTLLRVVSVLAPLFGALSKGKEQVPEQVTKTPVAEDVVQQPEPEKEDPFRKLVIDKLKRDEGVRKHAYYDSEGYLTIGIGRLCDAAFPSSGLRDSEMELMLSNDIDDVTETLDKNFAWFKDLDQARQYVLINMCFNLGITRLRKFKNFLSAVQQGDWEKAAVEMKDSAWWSQVGRRAVRLQDVMLTGDLSKA